MRLRTLCCALAVVPLGAARGQTRPQIDYHQHLFSPAIVALLAAPPQPTVELPQELDALMRARAGASRDRSALAELYTPDVWLLQSTGSAWVRGRDSVIAWWTQSATVPFRLTPTGWTVDGADGQIAGYLTDGAGDSTRHLAYLLLSVRKGPDARWRIATEALTTPGPVASKPLEAKDLIRLMDAAGIQRALVLSTAYLYGSPRRTVQDEYAKVKAENDWTGRQAAQYPDRLRAFCGFNPLKEYALDELARCANDPNLRRGIKLHFGNSDVNLHDAKQVEQLRRVFRAANERRMAIVVHMRLSISMRRAYGRDEAQIFLNEIVPAAPDIPIQIAHLAGTGPGYQDPAADSALTVFTDAIAAHDPRTKRLWFDVATSADLDIAPDRAALIATRIRQLGVGRVLYGSDGFAGGNLAPRQS